MLTFENIFPEVLKEPKKYKVHFAVNPSDDDPLHAFFKGEFKEWQEWQAKKNFERDFILSFIYYEGNEWLFAGIYRSISSKWTGKLYKYDTELLDIAQDLIGRLVIQFEKDFRNSYVYLERHRHKFKISRVFKERLAIMDFPGFENVRIDFSYLQTIIDKGEKSWKTALSSVNGIYLITDKQTGKLYVGSGYGEDGFWGRWGQYANSGHGYNVELKDLIKKKGIEYAQNFQFSILEIKSKTIDKEEIISRETHWKEVLFSRDFGYNKN